MILAKIENLDSFKDAMRSGEKVAARALWHGTSQSLARFRRDQFLPKTPANIRGKKSGNPRGRSAGRYPGIARTFRWTVSPPTPPQAKKFSSDHVKGVKEVAGEISTTSEAAESMEEGATITPKGAWLGIPIVSGFGSPNARKKRAGESKPRALPSWRTVSSILKKRAYNFQFQDKGSYMILWARHKDSSARPIPVMLLTKRVQMKKDGLQFFDLFTQFRSRVIETYDHQLRKQLQKLAYRAHKGG